MSIGAGSPSPRWRPFAQVDVFTDMPYSGNPLGVVLDAEGLSDDEMRRMTSWANLSETTFVLTPTEATADYRVRIFSPVAELPFAGHPTLGTAHAWLAYSGQDKARIVQQCGAGLVQVRRVGNGLSFAAPPLKRSGPVEAPLVAHTRPL